MKSSQPVVHEEKSTDPLISQFITKHSTILLDYINNEQIQTLMNAFKTLQDPEMIQLILSALKALLEYQIVLNAHSYPSVLITSYLRKKYSNLLADQSDSIKIKNFTRSLNYLTEILIELHDFNNQLNPLQHSLPDLNDSVYRRGKKWRNHLYEMIKPRLEEKTFELSENEYEYLLQSLQYATEVLLLLEDDEKAKRFISKMLTHASLMARHWDKSKEFTYAFIMFAATIETQHKILENKCVIHLSQILTQSQLDNLTRYFGIIDTDKIKLLDDSSKLLNCYLVVLSKDKSRDLKVVITNKYHELENQCHDEESIKGFNKTLSQLVEIFTQFDELNEYLTKHTKITLHAEAMSVLQSLLPILHRRLFNLNFTTSQSSSEELIEYIQHMKYSLFYFSMEEAELYIAALEHTMTSSHNWEFDELNKTIHSFIMAFKKEHLKQNFLKVSDEEQVETKVDTPVTFTQYVPHVVDLKDLNKNGNLYSQEMMNTIRALDLKVGVKVKKSVLQKVLHTNEAKWSVLRYSRNGYVSIYRGLKEGHQLGSGTYGSSRVAQHFNNGFAALKSIKTRDDCAAEVAGLRATGQFIFDYFHVTKRNELQKELLMKLAPGVNLYDVVMADRELAVTHWLGISFSITDEVDQLHKKLKVHGDLSLCNFVLNLMLSSVKLIDFGLTKEMSGYKEVLACAISPSHYIAPECTEGHFSYMSDIYSLGVVLAQLFRLGHSIKTKTGYEFVINSDTVPRPYFSDRLHSTEQSQKMRAHIVKMLSLDPYSRPSLAETKALLKEIQQSYQNSPQSIIHVAYLDLDFFKTCTNKIKALMIEELKNKDEVYFVDFKKRDPQYYIQFQQEFEKMMVFYKPVVLIATEQRVKQVLANHMKQLSATRSNQYHFEYFNRSHIFGEMLDKREAPKLRH